MKSPTNRVGKNGNRKHIPAQARGWKNLSLQICDSYLRHLQQLAKAKGLAFHQFVKYALVDSVNRQDFALYVECELRDGELRRKLFASGPSLN
jgi:hypothetical protein